MDCPAWRPWGRTARPPQGPCLHTDVCTMHRLCSSAPNWRRASTGAHVHARSPRENPTAAHSTRTALGNMALCAGRRTQERGDCWGGRTGQAPRGRQPAGLGGLVGSQHGARGTSPQVWNVPCRELLVRWVSATCENQPVLFHACELHPVTGHTSCDIYAQQKGSV